MDAVDVFLHGTAATVPSTECIDHRQYVLIIVNSHLVIFPQMEAVQKAGLTRHIGVSNFRVADLQLLLKTAKVKVRAPVQLLLWGRHVHAAPA